MCIEQVGTCFTGNPEVAPAAPVSSPIAVQILPISFYTLLSVGLMLDPLVGPQIPLEKRPDAIPGVALLGRIVAFESLFVHATAE